MGSTTVTPFDHRYDFSGGIRYFNLSGVSSPINALSIDREGRGQTEISLGSLKASDGSIMGKEFRFIGSGSSIQLGNLRVKGVRSCSESSKPNFPSTSAGSLTTDEQAAFNKADDTISNGSSVSLQKVISCEVEVSPIGKGGATVGGQSIELDGRKLLTLSLNLTTRNWEVGW